MNFSGGEPFIIDKGNYLGEMVRFCKEDLDMDSVTVVTNGSKVMLKKFMCYSYHCSKYYNFITVYSYYFHFHKGNGNMDERIWLLA